VIEVRPYFVFGDVLASAGVGALAAAAVAWLGIPSWPMVAGMLAGMMLGMFLGLVAVLAGLTILFGAMEVFVPCMLGGMLAGMVGAMDSIGSLPPALAGALTGLATLLLVYVVNAFLSGERCFRG
jgi:hypothetical protein